MKGSADTYPRNDGFRNLYEPLPHMRPHIRIAPFSAATLESLLAIRGETPGALEEPEAWLNKANSVRFYASGRAAISACLSQERLERADEVLIVTTTQGPYISSCVTEAIEAVCAWSRELTPRTKMALVIHEFGFPCDSSLIAECQARRIPVMEDCAYALGSRMEGASVGCFGDYAIYSLPKHFPVPFGGVLASRRDIIPPRAAEALPNGDKAFLVSALRKAMQIGSSPNEARRKNWQWFAESLLPFGMEPYFALPPAVVPGAFVARLETAVDGAKLKEDIVEAGVEATQYYCMGGFFLPVHECLTDYDKRYIVYHVAKSLAS